MQGEELEETCLIDKVWKKKAGYFGDHSTVEKKDRAFSGKKIGAQSIKRATVHTLFLSFTVGCG
jgi:hypothetical protein